MFFGGIYMEVVILVDIFWGVFYKMGYVWIFLELGLLVKLYLVFCDWSVSFIDNICLFDLKLIIIKDLVKVVKWGRWIVDKCDFLSYEIVLLGCFYFVFGLLVEVFICLWMSIE